MKGCDSQCAGRYGAALQLTAKKNQVSSPNDKKKEQKKWRNSVKYLTVLLMKAAQGRFHFL